MVAMIHPGVLLALGSATTIAIGTFAQVNGETSPTGYLAIGLAVINIVVTLINRKYDNQQVVRDYENKITLLNVEHKYESEGIHRALDAALASAREKDQRIARQQAQIDDLRVENAALRGSPPGRRVPRTGNPDPDPEPEVDPHGDDAPKPAG
jgi:hypothetical protein